MTIKEIWTLTSMVTIRGIWGKRLIRRVYEEGMMSRFTSQKPVMQAVCLKHFPLFIFSFEHHKHVCFDLPFQPHNNNMLYEVALYADRNLLSLMICAAVIAYQDEILVQGKWKLKLNFTVYIIQAKSKTLCHVLKKTRYCESQWYHLIWHYVIKYLTAYMN